MAAITLEPPRSRPGALRGEHHEAQRADPEGEPLGVAEDINEPNRPMFSNGRVAAEVD